MHNNAKILQNIFTSLFYFTPYQTLYHSVEAKWKGKMKLFYKPFTIATTRRLKYSNVFLFFLQVTTFRSQHPLLNGKTNVESIKVHGGCFTLEQAHLKSPSCTFRPACMAFNQDNNDRPAFLLFLLASGTYLLRRLERGKCSLLSI